MLLFAALGALHSCVPAADITGQLRIPAIVGNPAAGSEPVIGGSAFFSPVGEGTGLSATWPGESYSFSVPPGEYSVLLEPNGYNLRGKVIPNLRVDVDMSGWDQEISPGYHLAPRTIAMGGSFAQSFMATGTSVTSVGFKLAGMFSGAVISVGVHDSDGDLVGPARTLEPERDPEVSVTWDSGEVPTVPGQTYVLEVADVDEEPFGLYVHPDGGLAYPYGELFINGKKSTFDGSFFIGSDNDGTLLSVNAPAGEGTLPAASRFTRTFRAVGTSLAAVSFPFRSAGEVPEISFEVRRGNENGDQVCPVRTTVPARAADGTYHAGIACPKEAIPMTPGDEFTLIISAPEGAMMSPFRPAGDDEAGFALRVYELAAETVAFEFPPPPVWEPDGTEETLTLTNPGFEKGDDSGWESAWGGGHPFEVVGKGWRPDLFPGATADPKEGGFCGVVAADHQPVKKLIRQWASWDSPSKNGQVRAVVWVASSDNADDVANPVQVRICVSGHGSIDAGNVAWSEPVISPGKWTPLVSPPAVPAGGKMTLFLLVEGGGEDSEQYLKVDDLRLIVDRK